MTRKNAAGGIDVYVQLAPAESCIVKTFAMARIDGPPFDFWRAADTSGGARALNGPWSLTFASGGPMLPAAGAGLTQLGSWTERPDNEAKAFAGTAVYRTKFDGADGRDLLLDLGRVADSARIRVNGKDVAALIGPPWRAVVGHDLLKPAGNELEVIVTNLAANRIADLDRRDPSWKKFYNTNYPARVAANRGPDGNFSAAKMTPRPSGLLGPVTLTPAISVTAK
jgi:hypothetical protein